MTTSSLLHHLVSAWLNARRPLKNSPRKVLRSDWSISSPSNQLILKLLLPVLKLLTIRFLSLRNITLMVVSTRLLLVLLVLTELRSTTFQLINSQEVVNLMICWRCSTLLLPKLKTRSSLYCKKGSPSPMSSCKAASWSLSSEILI